MATISGTVNGIAGGWVRVFAFDVNNLSPYATGPANLTLTEVFASDFYATANAVTGAWSSTSAKIGSRYLLLAYPINTPINTAATYYGDVTNPTDAQIVHVMEETVEDLDITLEVCTDFMSGTISNVLYSGAGNITIAQLLRPYAGHFILENQGVPSNVWDGNLTADNATWYHATPADEEYVVMYINQDVGGTVGEAMFEYHMGETGLYAPMYCGGNDSSLDGDFDYRYSAPNGYATSTWDNAISVCSQNVTHMVDREKNKCAECAGPLKTVMSICKSDQTHRRLIANTPSNYGYVCYQCSGDVDLSTTADVMFSQQDRPFVEGNTKNGNNISKPTSIY